MDSVLIPWAFAAASALSSGFSADPLLSAMYDFCLRAAAEDAHQGHANRKQE